MRCPAGRDRTGNIRALQASNSSSSRSNETPKPSWNVPVKNHPVSACAWRPIAAHSGSSPDRSVKNRTNIVPTR